MSEAGGADAGTLPPTLLERIIGECDHFELLWRRGANPLIEAFLDAAYESLRPDLLRELIAVEVDLRRGRGDQPEPAEYLARFPGNPEQVGDAFRGSTMGAALRPRALASDREEANGPPTPGMKVGPYTLIRPLGRGGFGVVWLAERVGAIATTQVALKMPLEGTFDLGEIRREADLWVRAGGHPNVLPIIEADIYDGRVVIVSEFAPDGSLAGWLKGAEGGRLAVEDAADLLLEIVDGLEHLHVRKILHRDLKPANILLQGRTPRIADFGLARVLGVSPQSGAVSGTPAYMAPEALVGERTERSDLWSVGVIGHQILSGQLPFRGENVFALMHAIAGSPPEPLPDAVPQPLHEVIHRALAKEPEHRYRTAADMRAALREAMRQLTASRQASVSDVRRHSRAVAVTGSMVIDADRAMGRLAELATPYLGPHTTWYCGTYGAVDEAAAAYLRGEGQRVIAVGYHAQDLTPRMSELTERLAIPIVDAQHEEVPSVPGAPSRRDIYFTTKADLLLVLWDGQSTGTGRLLEWLRRQGKDHLIGFVK